jgi:endonuclease/exonuclease/phosphatase family metal-dependent hydrolase
MAYLEHALGMQATFSPAADGQFGNAVLTSAPILAESVGRVPYVGGQERSYTRSEVQTEAGPWVVVGAHLENGDARQTAALFDLVGEASPAVIAGDLNVHPDWPNAANLTAFTDAVAATGDACRTTSAEPTSACDRPDWILVGPRVEVVSLEIGTTAASDHLPMVASVVRAG